MAMTMNEMMQAMQDAGCDGSSTLHMRSESIQNRPQMNRIPTLRNKLKKKSKLLLMTELAFPFNPATGEPDEKFNNDNKYRPPMSATTVALAMKDYANTNEALKSTLMKRSGVSEWDTSVAEFTPVDWKVFAPYRVPKIFTVIATHINIPAMGTGQFGRDYAVSVERDPKTGEIVGELPSFLKVNKLFNDKAYEQIHEYEEKIASGDLKQTKDQQDAYKQQARSACCVSNDKHINYVQMFEIPLDNKYVVDEKVISSDNLEQEVKGFEVISRYKQKIRQAVESYKDGSWERFDKNFDFWEIEMTCPSTGDDSTNSGKAEIGRETKFEKPTVTLQDTDEYDGGKKTEALVTAIRSFVDADLDIEQEMRRSMMISVFDDSVEAAMFNCLKTVLDLKGDKYLTNKVIQSNAEMISLIFGDEGDEVLEEINAGVSEKNEGNLDEDDSKSTAKQYDLSSSEFQTESEEMSDFENVDLESID